MTAGMKSSEFLALVAGLLTAVLPVVLEKVPSSSAWAVILGALMAAASYIAGRSYVKATGLKAEAIRAVGERPPANP